MARKVLALLAVLAIGACVVTAMRTRTFIQGAKHASGRVTSISPDPPHAQIEFAAANGAVIAFSVDGFTLHPVNGAVGVLYKDGKGAETDARADDPRVLWSSTLDWIPWVIGFGFFAVFGRALLEDPFSVIAFRGTSRRTISPPRGQ